ncbi:MAG: hypothetical protein IPH03_00065 [Tetrasphaera sp.]|nr:hypothetical protein [Tetrasphaera sp.]
MGMAPGDGTAAPPPRADPGEPAAATLETSIDTALDGGSDAGADGGATSPDADDIADDLGLLSAGPDPAFGGIDRADLESTHSDRMDPDAADRGRPDLGRGL